jgi:hypothetical protein
MNANRQAAWWCLGAVSIIVSLSAIGWMGYDTFIRARDNQLEFTQQKLFDCTNSIVSVQFVMPESKEVSLVLGLQQSKGFSFDYDGKPARPFVGSVEFRRAGVTIVSFPIEHSSAQACTWLNNQGIPEAYILNWSNRNPWLPDILKAGVSYELRVEFTENAPTNASVWASLLQRHADVQRSNSIVMTPRQP